MSQHYRQPELLGQVLHYQQLLLREALAQDKLQDVEVQKELEHQEQTWPRGF